MSTTETVDIIVRESGSIAAAGNIRKVAASSAEGQARLEAFAATMGGSSSKLAEVARQSGAAEQQLRQVGASAQGAAAGHKAHNVEMDHSAHLMDHLRETLVALGLALGIHEWVELTDEYQKNVNGLKQVVSSQENLVATQRALKDISMETFSDLNANTTLYVRMSKAGKDLNITQTEMLTVVRVLNDGLRLAGNTTSDAGRAITQLSVAMMTGEGSSRALLSIMRQMPDLTQALAQKFFTGKESVGQFKTAVENGTISIQSVIKAISSLSSTQADLRTQMDASTSTTRAHSAATLTDAEQTMVASGRMYDLSKVTGETNKTVIDLSKVSADAGRHVVDLSGNATHAATSLGHATDEIKKMGPAATQSFDQVGHGIQNSDRMLTAFEKNVKKVEPTIAEAWQNIKTALFSYVGEADQASAASEKVAHVLEIVAHNGQTFFGVLTVITAFLGTYVAASTLAYASTLLFVTAFSRVTLIISLLAAATVAIYSFGQGIKLTASGSISALGALLGVLDLLKQGIMFVWNLVGQAPGYWGQAVVAVGALMIAMRVLLGVNIIVWVVQITSAMLALAAATLVAVGPWGLLAAAIVAAALAFAYYNGNLDGAIATLKDKLTPVVNDLIDKMKSFTTESVKSGTAAKDFGNVWTGQVTNVTNGFSEGLTPSIKNTQAAMDALKQASVSDMSQTASAVDSVTQELSKMTSTAAQAASATSSIKGPSSSGSGSGTSAAAMTGTFATWQLVQPWELEAAINRAAQISSSEGSAVNTAGLKTMLDNVQKNPFDSKNMAEALQALSGFSSNAKSYLKTRLGPMTLPIGFANGGSFQVGGNGGTDSQLVQFMASPDETVSVATPQQASGGRGSGARPINVTMVVQATDANSFSRTSRQLVTQLEGQLNRIQLRGP